MLKARLGAGSAFELTTVNRSDQTRRRTLKGFSRYGVFGRTIGTTPSRTSR